MTTADPGGLQYQYGQKPGEIVTPLPASQPRALRIVDTVTELPPIRHRNDSQPAANAERHREGTRKVNDTKQSTEDLAILDQLNNDYVHSDQFNDVKRFSEFLAEDFIVQTPGVTRNREEFLEYIAKPRPFKDLAVHDVNIRILSDVALIHARATYTMLADGVEQEALYTDTYQKREGTWVCVAACAIAPGA
ncbi:nuclear transport factor 2 family protein [Mycobacterium sp. URHB0021]